VAVQQREAHRRLRPVVAANSRALEQPQRQARVRVVEAAARRKRLSQVMPAQSQQSSSS